MLLLQGPVGGFFNQFSAFLKKNIVNVYKIHFHYGEKVFYRQGNDVLYDGTVAAFAQYIESYYRDNQIQQIYLLGEFKVYHQIAKRVAQEKGVEVFVFEEGYIRPDFITIEKNGVNGRSSLLKNRDGFFEWDNVNFVYPKRQRNLPRWRWPPYHLWVYIKYGYALTFSGYRLPNYQHHLPYKGWRQFLLWHRLILQLSFGLCFFPYRSYALTR